MLRLVVVSIALLVSGDATYTQTQTGTKPFEPTVGQPGKDVVWVPTPQSLVDKMLDMAKVKKDDILYDLGCGDGRIPVTAVASNGAKRGVGIDLDPQRIKDSNENAKQAGVTEKVEFKVGDILKLQSVADANVVTLYLYPDVNRKLEPMLRKTLKPGARVVSHDFKIGDWPPEKTERVKGARKDDHVIYLWTIK
jgi:cyclopropane fatty-acyl-phospholipid synthase-like methyltransferase